MFSGIAFFFQELRFQNFYSIQQLPEQYFRLVLQARSQYFIEV